jgi:Na+-translocating ferredoxin:NAD+ oxidoreductase RnfC subunit
MNLVDQVRNAGVVGAGGGGFPTHVKLASSADTVIANGAECEPLLHKDAELMAHEAAALVRGVELAMVAVGARTGIVGVKAKNHHAVEAVRAACADGPVRVLLLGDYYPAGDEYDLVFEATGRLIPPSGIPLHVGVVVCNIETFINITAAAAGRPVTHKTLTVAGAVHAPVTLTVPLGTSLADCIAAAGGAAVPDSVLAVGGMMMGETVTDLDRPVTKTTGGLIVLPRTHRVMTRKLTPAPAQHAIGKSACDQCRYCTEYCPRYLLGYAVEPHQVMRGLAFTGTGEAHWNQWASMCCSCGLCTLFACPEDLFPKEACDEAKSVQKAAGLKWSGPTEVTPHALRDGRRVPIKALLRKLHLEAYDHPAPWRATTLTPDRLVLPLKQHAGVAAHPVVKVGDRVTAGQRLAEIPAAALAATLHAPTAATVAALTTDQIVLHCA